MSKSEEDLFSEWRRSAKYTYPERRRELSAFLAGRASLTDEIAKLREQRDRLLNCVQFYANECDDDDGLEARAVLGEVAAIEIESASPDAGKDEVCENDTDGDGNCHQCIRQGGCFKKRGTGKRTEGK